MKLNIHKNIFLPAYYDDLRDYGKRFLVLYGGAGSGKSHYAAQKLVFKALTDKRKILVLRKINKTTKNSTFQMLLDTLSQFQILNYCRINRTDFTITLPNGSVFLCMGLDDSEKIKSITGLTDAWLEEATEFTLDDFSQINLRIRAPGVENQQIILSFNPVSKANWCYLQFFAENVDYDEFRQDVKIIHTSYLDNRFLPEEYVKALLQMKNTNEPYYKIYALGEFGSLDKLVYNNWQILEFDKDKIKGQTACGLDFGYTNDPTAFVASIVTEDRIYVFKEWGGTGFLNDQIARAIQTIGFGKSVIMADSAEQKSIDEIKRLGVQRIKPCVKGKGSILQGIQKLQQYEIIVHPDCENVIEELNNYSWKKDKNTNEYINEPLDMYNHYLDALRYSMQCLDQRLQLNTMSKDRLF